MSIPILWKINIQMALFLRSLAIQEDALKQMDMYIMSNVKQFRRHILVITMDNIGMATGAVLVAVLEPDPEAVAEKYIKRATPVDHPSILGFWAAIKAPIASKKLN